MRPLTHLLSFALLVCLIASTQTFAQSAIWQGAGTPGKFEDPNNWLGGTLPSSGNAAFIGLGDSGTITTEGTATIDTATGTVTTGTLSLGASTFTSAAGQDNGTLYIHGGALNIDGVAALGSNAALIIGGLGNSTLSTGGGSGTLIMDGGQINFSAVNAGIGMGFNASGEPDSTGYFEMDGGSINYSATTGNNNLTVSLRGIGYMKMTGGSINMNGIGANNGSLQIARASGASATLDMSGGTINCAQVLMVNGGGTGGATLLLSGGAINTTTRFRGSADFLPSFVNVSGGTLSSNGSFTVAESGSNPTLTLHTTGTFLVSGGVVTTQSGFNLASGSFSYGTLSASAGTMNIASGLNLATGPNSVANSRLDGAVINAGSVSCANDNFAIGTLDIHTGILNASSINVASSGGAFGYLLLEGGTINLSGTSTMNIATNGNATVGFASGLLKITGGRLNAGSIQLANSSTSNGTFDLEGGTVVAAGRIDLDRVSGGNGTFIMAQADPNVPTELCVSTLTFASSPKLQSYTGGTLTVGTFALAGPTFGGITLSPGDFTTAGGGAAYGTTNVRGSSSAQGFTMGSGSSLHMDVGSDSNTHDTVHLWGGATGGAVGNVTLAAGSFIDVDFHGDTDNPPALGTTWDLIVLDLATTAGNITDNSTLRTNTPGWTWSKAVVGDGVTTPRMLELTLDAVPEPSMLGVIALGMTLTLFPRRPRQKRRPT